MCETLPKLVKEPTLASSAALKWLNDTVMPALVERLDADLEQPKTELEGLIVRSLDFFAMGSTATAAELATKASSVLSTKAAFDRSRDLLEGGSVGMVSTLRAQLLVRVGSLGLKVAELVSASKGELSVVKVSALLSPKCSAWLGSPSKSNTSRE